VIYVKYISNLYSVNIIKVYIIKKIEASIKQHIFCVIYEIYKQRNCHKI